jgi:hypothetical protein
VSQHQRGILEGDAEGTMRVTVQLPVPHGQPPAKSKLIRYDTSLNAAVMDVTIIYSKTTTTTSLTFSNLLELVEVGGDVLAARAGKEGVFWHILVGMQAWMSAAGLWC